MKKVIFLLASGLLCPLALFAQNLDWKSADVYRKKDIKTQLESRLTSYAKQNTNTPALQLKFAKNLAKELRKYGAEVTQTKNGLLTASLSGNTPNQMPSLVFLSRLDSPAVNVKPELHTNYTGGQIEINPDKKIVLDIYNSPELTRAYGHDLLTSDGSSALGAQPKAGTAVLLTVLQYLDEHPSVSHGPLQFIFMPENSFAQLDPKQLKNSYGYLLSGSGRGEITDETFSGRRFTITFKGNRTVEPGQASNTAFADNLLVASDFHTLLPRHLRPDTTSGTRGFIYVDNIIHQGNKTEITGLIRAFSENELNQLTNEVSRAFKTVKAMHNKAQNFTLNFEDQFQNIKSALPASALTCAETAMKQEDITPKRVASRVQTGVEQAITNGFAIIELFTGQYNPNSNLEYADVDVMEDSFRTVMRLISLSSIPVKTEH